MCYKHRIIMSYFTVIESIPNAGRYAGTRVFTASLTNGFSFVGIPGKSIDEMLKSATLRNKIQQNGPFNVENEQISLFNRNDIKSATRDFEKIFGGLFLYMSYEGLTKEKIFQLKKNDDEMKCKFEKTSENTMQVSARFVVHEKIKKALEEERKIEEEKEREQENEKQNELLMNVQNVQDGENVNDVEMNEDEFLSYLHREIDTIKSSEDYEVANMICNLRNGATYDHTSCGCANCKIVLIEKEIKKRTVVVPEIEHVEIVEQCDSEPEEPNYNSCEDGNVDHSNYQLSTKEVPCEYVGSKGVDCSTVVVWEDLALKYPPDIRYEKGKVLNVVPFSGYSNMECYAIVCRMNKSGYWCGARMYVNGNIEVVRVFFSTLDRLRVSEGDIVLVTGVQFGVGVSCNILGRITRKVEQKTLPKDVIDNLLDYQIFDLTNGTTKHPKLFESDKLIEEFDFEFEDDGEVFRNEIDTKRGRREERTKKVCIHQDQCNDLDQTPGACPLCPNGINKKDSWKKFLKNAVGLEGCITNEKINLREIRAWGKKLGWNLDTQHQNEINEDEDEFDNSAFVKNYVGKDTGIEGDESDIEEIEIIDNTTVEIVSVDSIGLKKAHGGKRERKKATKGRHESRAYTRGEEQVDASEKKARRGTKRGNNKKGGQVYIGGKASGF